MYIVQYIYLPTEQAETYRKICDISFNTYLSQLVRLQGEYIFLNFCEIEL